MKGRKVIGIVLIVIGIAVFLLGLYAKGRVREAKENVNKSSGLFPGNPVNKEISSALEHKIGSYDAPIVWTMIGGVVIFVIGVGTLVSCKRK